MNEIVLTGESAPMVKSHMSDCKQNKVFDINNDSSLTKTLFTQELKSSKKEEHQGKINVLL